MCWAHAACDVHFGKLDCLKGIHRIAHMHSNRMRIIAHIKIRIVRLLLRAIEKTTDSSFSFVVFVFLFTPPIAQSILHVISNESTNNLVKVAMTPRNMPCTSIWLHFPMETRTEDTEQRKEIQRRKQKWKKEKRKKLPIQFAETNDQSEIFKEN